MNRLRNIGPAGTIARIVVGGALVALTVWSPGWWAGEGPLWSDLLLGLALFPAAAIALQWLRAAFTSERLNATDGIAGCVNFAIGAALFAFGYTTRRRGTLLRRQYAAGRGPGLRRVRGARHLQLAP